jgi:hypothetical protein
VSITPPPSADDARAIQAAREAVLGGERSVRHTSSLIVDSWLRSAAAGLDADHNVAPVTLEQAELADYRDAHPLSSVFPLLYDVLGRAAEACDSVMAIADAEGQLLWVCGSSRNVARAEAINFVEGSAWGEAAAGTNAPGTALRLDTAVQIRGAEHFTRAVQRWSCAAAPIHDPETQMILGVVDVTGGRDVDSPQTMAMVRAAARMAEAELGRLQAVGRVRGSLILPVDYRLPRPLVIEGLGRPDCQVDDGSRTIRLSRRHSEILTILTGFPEGVTSQRLAVELYADDGNLSTLRAEMTRLRALLGADVIDSRPYRLQAPAECDWLTVEAHLAAGQVADALRCYRGPLLPQSEAPNVVATRERLERMLRTAILDSGRVDLMHAWTRSRWGADDLETWQRQADVLPTSSPLLSVATAEIARLAADLGLPAGGAPLRPRRS